MGQSKWFLVKQKEKKKSSVYKFKFEIFLKKTLKYKNVENLKFFCTLKFFYCFFCFAKKKSNTCRSNHIQWPFGVFVSCTWSTSSSLLEHVGVLPVIYIFEYPTLKRNIRIWKEIRFRVSRFEPMLWRYMVLG